MAKKEQKLWIAKVAKGAGQQFNISQWPEQHRKQLQLVCNMQQTTHILVANESHPDILSAAGPLRIPGQMATPTTHAQQANHAAVFHDTSVARSQDLQDSRFLTPQFSNAMRVAPA